MKFAIGDHVRVREDSRWDDQRGLTGVIVEVQGVIRTLPIRIKYDEGSDAYPKGHENYYDEEDLEHTELNNSPLYQALR